MPRPSPRNRKTPHLIGGAFQQSNRLRFKRRTMPIEAARAATRLMVVGITVDSVTRERLQYLQLRPRRHVGQHGFAPRTSRGVGKNVNVSSKVMQGYSLIEANWKPLYVKRTEKLFRLGTGWHLRDVMASLQALPVRYTM